MNKPLHRYRHHPILWIGSNGETLRLRITAQCAILLQSISALKHYSLPSILSAPFSLKFLDDDDLNVRKYTAGWQRTWHCANSRRLRARCPCSIKAKGADSVSSIHNVPHHGLHWLCLVGLCLTRYCSGSFSSRLHLGQGYSSSLPCYIATTDQQFGTVRDEYRVEMDRVLYSAVAMRPIPGKLHRHLQEISLLTSC